MTVTIPTQSFRPFLNDRNIFSKAFSYKIALKQICFSRAAVIQKHFWQIKLKALILFVSEKFQMTALKSNNILLFQEKQWSYVL